MMIPEMTDPLGKHWRQPKREEIALDDVGQAAMSKETFDLLPEYSASRPSGVYEGKMWKARGGEHYWLLFWYGPSDKPEMCSINHRVIVFTGLSW